MRMRYYESRRLPAILQLTPIDDVVIPYQEPTAKGDSAEFGSTLSSTLPMAAVFMRNRYVGW